MRDEMGCRLQSGTSGVGVIRHVESLKMNVSWKLHTFPSLIVGGRFWIFLEKLKFLCQINWKINNINNENPIKYLNLKIIFVHDYA